MNLVEPFRRIARQQPSLPAVVSDDRTLSYGELLAEVAGLAAWFHADGIRPGHKVAVYGNPLMRVASTLALAWIGAVSTDTSGLSDDRVGELADAFGLDVIYSPRELRLVGSRTRVARIGGLLEVTGAPPPLWEGPDDALWRITVSSGTTGRPKGIACTYASVLNVHLLRTVYPCGPGDVVVLAMNPAMSLAVHNWLRCLYTGACAFLAEKLRAAELLRLLQSGTPTHCMASPAVATALTELCTGPQAPEPAAGKRLHTFSVAGGRVSAGVREAISTHICPNFISHYGAAEAHIVAILDPELVKTNPGCSGRILPWMEAQAIDEDGNPLPAGEAGRLRFRSPALTVGYLGQPDDGTFRDGWFHSQDRGIVGAKGLIFIRGRTNDVINFEGLKIDPEMLEDAVMADTDIVECAIVDLPGATGPELVAVVVSRAASIDRAALVERCVKAAPGVRIRRVVRSPRLPRNDNGKIMRDAVRRGVQKSLKEGDDVA